MKSKYTKIFMIFAVVFAMVAALFVSPKAAYAEDAEQIQLTAKEEYDVNAISASIPDTAIISFPVPYESVYGNKIEWAVEEEDKDIISYDEDAHWMVVNRLEDVDQTATVYLYINEKLAHAFEIEVPKGITFVPTYTITYDYEVGDSAPTSYKLGQASITLPTPTREGYIFNGWKDGEGKVYTKILVGSMENIELTAEWTKIVVDRIELDTTNLVKTDYISGDPLKTEGLVVTAYFNDGTNRVVTEGIEFDTEHIEYNDSGNVTITVTYQGKSDSFVVNVSKKENSVVIAEFNGWTYGTPVVPTATSTYGTPILLYSNSEKGVYSEDAPTNAGVYYVKAVVEEGADFLGAESDPVEFTISEKNITLTPVSQGTVNISDVQNLKWSFTTNDLVYEDSLPEEYEGLVVKYYLEENGEPVNPMAGQVYIVKFSGFTMDNYIVTFVDGSLSVKSEELYFYIPDVEYVYDGTIKMFTAKAYAENGDNDILIEDAEVVYTYNGQPFTGATLANEEGYSVTVSIDSPSYGKLEQVVSFVIEKATINTNSATLTGASKEYNNNNQMISVQGLPEDDKVVVSYNITEAINVGTYEVVATISSNDPNYKVSKSELTATLEITKAANTVTVAIQGWIYGDEAKAPSATVTFGEATFTYATEENGEYTSTVPTDAGTYYVKATVAGTDNYEAASATQEFTIAQAVIDLSNATLTGASKEYNNNNQMISVQGLPEDDKVVVSYNITEAINVGTYEVVATISSNDPNYKVSKSELTATLEITKAANTVTVAIQGWIYGDEAKAPSATVTFGEATFTYATEENGEYTSTVPTDAGTYYVKATVAGTDNYEGATDTASFTISKKLLTNDDVKVIVLGSDFNTSVETTLTPDVEVYYNQTQITTYDELQYVYGNAETKLGTATVTIVLNGNYEGTLTAPFEVTKFGQAGVDAAGLPETIDEAYLTANALPVTVGQGEVKSNVLWSSSNTAVSVNPVSGKVSINKAQLADDTTIILTAIVTYGTTSAYKVTYNVVITAAPEVEDITNNGVTIFDAPYGYEVVAEEVADTNENANYKAAVEANEGYEYVNAYNISLKDELGQSKQPGKTVLVRINGTFDTSKTYRVYYVDGSDTTEIVPTTVTETYIEFETDHFSIYAIAVEEEEVHVHTPAEAIEEYRQESTCTVAGHYYSVIKCSECDVEISRTKEIIPALGHIDENDENTCDRCGYIKAESWILVTDVNDLTIGDQIVIVASGSDVALSTTQNGNNRGQTNISKNDSKVVINSNVQIITLEAGAGDYPWSFNVKTGYLYAPSTSDNHLKTQLTNNSKGHWTISIQDGVATIKANQSTKNTLRYNSSSKIFSCYSSGQNDISIYKNIVEYKDPMQISKYTVTFEVDGNIKHTYTVNEGEKVDQPDDPSKEDYTFVCWMNGDSEFDFNTPINSDIELVAKFISNIISGESKNVSADIYGTNGTLSNDVISWKLDNVTLSNEKGSTAIRTSDSDHYRIYQNSKVIVEVSSGSITKIVFTVSESKYATPLQTSLTNSGYTASVSGNKVTVVTVGVSKIEFSASAQIRINNIEVTYTN